VSKFVDRYWVYDIQGRKLHLWKIRRFDDNVPSTDGELFSDARSNYLVYPPEAITNGLRIEHTSITKPFTTNNPNTVADSSLSEDASPTESSYINLSRLLTLAVVDYVRAMLAEKSADVQKKEYYMREFYKKAGDNESNKRKILMTGTMSPYAVR
jgi:hypothetical protein|tara:strand:- start:561 stop:1025 length:465 start_codon:yes stop_codon:yes gene_type:complete